MYETIMCAIANVLGILHGSKTEAKLCFGSHLETYCNNQIKDAIANMSLVHWYDDVMDHIGGFYGIIYKDETGEPLEWLIRLYDGLDMVTTTHILSRAVVAYIDKLNKAKEKENEGF